MSYIGTFVTEIEPDRECWHEAGHAIVADHFGMQVQAIGYQWNAAGEPNPCTWVAFNGLDKECVAIQYFAGAAAEIIKLGDHDLNAYRFGPQRVRSFRTHAHNK